MFGSARFRAICIGNVIEYYDWAIFASFSGVLAEEYFDSSNQKIGILLQGFALFGSAFLMRPIGGLIFGSIGDKISREKALEYSVFCMFVSSTLMMLLPPRQVGGAVSSIVLVILRLLQGLACGGEMVGAMVHAMETTRQDGGVRGHRGGLTKATSTLGASLGMGASALTRSLLSEEQLSLYGWRICYAGGAILAAVGFKMRESMIKSRHREIEGSVAAVVTRALRSTSYSRSTSASSRATLSTTDDFAKSDYTVHATAPPLEWNEAEDTPETLPISPAIEVKGTPNASMNVSSYRTSLPCSDAHAKYFPVLCTSQGEIAQKQEQEEGKANDDAGALVMCVALKSQKTEILFAFLFLSFWCVSYYTVCVWNGFFLTSSELIEESTLGERPAWWLIFYSNLLLALMLPIGGYIGDLWHQQISLHSRENRHSNFEHTTTIDGLTSGHRRTMLVGAVLALIGAPFAYIQLTSGNLLSCFTAQSFLVIAISLFGGNMPCYLCEMFPEAIRYTGVGLSYNSANAVIAGSTAFIQTTLVVNGPQWSNQRDFATEPIISEDCSMGGKCWWSSMLECVQRWFEYVLEREVDDRTLRPSILIQLFSFLAIISLTLGASVVQRRQLARRLSALGARNRALREA